MVKCLIVDDEPLALEVLENHISKSSTLQLAGKCLNAMQAFEALHHLPVDLLFIDIKMPGLSGIDFIKSLKQPPSFIFTTAYPEFAVTSYELGAIDYLLKPITFERFTTSVGKYIKIQPEPSAASPYSYFKVNGRMIRVEHADILYAQSVKDYVMIYTNKEKYMTHMTTKYLSDLLPASNFRRVHRSFLVNLDHVTSFRRNELGIGGITIPIGDNYKLNMPEP